MAIKHIKGILEIREQGMSKIKCSSGRYAHLYRLTVYEGSGPQEIHSPGFVKTGSTKSLPEETHRPLWRFPARGANTAMATQVHESLREPCADSLGQALTELCRQRGETGKLLGLTQSGPPG